LRAKEELKPKSNNPVIMGIIKKIFQTAIVSDENIRKIKGNNIIPLPIFRKVAA
jgi:hypothetical protein